MVYALPNNLDAANGIRHAIEDQLGKIEDTIHEEDDIHEAVHDVRKRYKKIRAAARLARGALGDDYTPFNVHFRDAGRQLSDIRDAHARLETLDVIEDAYSHVLADDAFDALRRTLTEQRDQHAEEMSLEAVLSGMLPIVETGREMMRAWSWTSGGYDDLVPGLEKSFRRSQKRMKKSYQKGTVHQFHEWRKRVKYHRYHLRLLRENLPSILNPQRDLHHELSDLLGEYHDLAVFEEVMDARDLDIPTEVLDALKGLFDERSQRLRQSAQPLGRMLFDEPAETMSRRIGRYWKFARSDRPEIYVY